MSSVIGLSFIGTLVIVKIIDATIGLRVESEIEQTGLDRALHAESAYND
jgi:Amt family ammonium transporter